MYTLDPKQPIAAPTLEWLDLQFSTHNAWAVPVFDFDGVLSSPREDAVYRLAERVGERDKLMEPAQYYEIDYDLYDTPYLRHLVLQAILADLGDTPEQGPLLPLSIELSRARRPFFILTARSGIAAINRAMQFVAMHNLTPQEVFFVGRGPKDRQLALARNTINMQSKICYFEDSLEHSRSSVAQGIVGLETIHVAWKQVDHSEAELFLNGKLDWFRKNRSRVQETRDVRVNSKQ